MSEIKVGLTKPLVLSVLMFTVLATGSASRSIADHRDDFSDLQTESYQLQRVVQFSTIRNRVKTAITRFVRDVDSIRGCETGFEPNLEPMDPPGVFLPPAEPEFLEPVVDSGQPRRLDIVTFDHNSDCFEAHQRLRFSWSETERYLYDTNFDYPSIYYQYLRTRNAVSEFLLEQ